MENDINTVASQSTSYKDLMVEAGKQLGLRKGDILKRVILATWPIVILLFSVTSFGIYSQTHPDIAERYGMQLAVIAILWAIFSILYGAIVRTIFFIEKRIWIDSYFDGKNLTNGQSWRIATKLFFPSVFFRIKLFLRYYAIIWFIYFALIPACFLIGDPYAGIAFAIVLLGFPVIMWIYSHYYLQAYLRFAWFLFLDTFGSQENGFGSIVSEMKKLNTVSKSDSFKKALVAELGSDSITFIADVAVNSILSGISAVNQKAGAIVGSLTKVPAEEMAKQSADFAKLSAVYLLYRKARELSEESPQSVNEKIYSL
jgi:hypothetical protein